MTTVKFIFERATKNTYRFAEDSDNPIIGTLYVKKSAFKNGQPNTLSVTINEA